MTAPLPNDAGSPLVEGMDPSWNSVLQYIPEDKRPEVVPFLQEREKSYKETTDNYSNWKKFSDSGVTPEQADMALNTLAAIENNPKLVYDSLGKFLNITPQEAKEIVEEIEETGGESQFDIEKDPRFAAMKQQVDAMAGILLAQKDEQERTAAEKEQEAELEKEFENIRKTKGDFPEEEIVMRMLHLKLSPIEAYEHYQKSIGGNQQRRPSPFILAGGAGQVPKPGVDVTKLDSKQSRSLVADMLRHANAERRS